MRMRRFTQGRGDYLDLLDICRHLAALHQYDDLANVADQGTQLLSGTLAVAAFLAEIRPFIPDTERAWILVADLELRTFLAAGNIPAAVRLAETIHHQVHARAAADPSNTEWQRDLSISHERLGELAVAAGDLNTAQQRFQAGLSIRERLAAADPSNTAWQRDLSINQQRLMELKNAQDSQTTATQYSSKDDDVKHGAGFDQSA
jgi:tetratricopeptide (TPR) repeat protein